MMENSEMVYGKSFLDNIDGIQKESPMSDNNQDVLKPIANSVVENIVNNLPDDNNSNKVPVKSLEENTTMKHLFDEVNSDNKKIEGQLEVHEFLKQEIIDIDVKVEIIEGEECRKAYVPIHSNEPVSMETGNKKEDINVALLKVKLDSEFKCPECMKIFQKERYLKMHIKEVHMVVQMSICHICSKEYKYFHLKKHIQNVHINEESACDECGKVYTNRKHLRDHKRSVHEGLDLLCHLCSKSFKSKSYLSNHVRRFHNSVDEERVCDYCSKVFNTQNKLYLHIKAVHTIENLPCLECGKIYRNSYLLRKHMKHNHKSEAI